MEISDRPLGPRPTRPRVEGRAPGQSHEGTTPPPASRRPEPDRPYGAAVGRGAGPAPVRVEALPRPAHESDRARTPRSRRGRERATCRPAWGCPQLDRSPPAPPRAPPTP